MPLANSLCFYSDEIGAELVKHSNLEILMKKFYELL